MLLKNLRYTFLSILISLTIFSSISYARSCVEDYACVDISEKNDKKTLYIENLKTCEITATFTFTKLENMESSKDVPYSVTVPPLKKIKVLDLKQKNKRLKWEYYYKYNVVAGTMNAHHDNSYIYSLPYHSGESHEIIQGFNGTFSHFGEQKYSLDFDLREGSEVLASRAGEVVAIKTDSNEGGADKSYASKANYVYVKHSDGTFGAYLHLKQNSIKVFVGQKVHVGELLALSGNTGFSSGPHLHFWVYKAKNGLERESFPIKFRTTNGTETLLQSKNYIAP